MLFCAHGKCNRDQGTALLVPPGTVLACRRSALFGCRVLRAVPVQGGDGLLELAGAGKAHDGAVPEDGDMGTLAHRSGAAVAGGAAARSIPPRLGVPPCAPLLHGRPAPEAAGSVRRSLFFMCDRPVAPVWAPRMYHQFLSRQHQHHLEPPCLVHQMLEPPCLVHQMLQYQPVLARSTTWYL